MASGCPLSVELLVDRRSIRVALSEILETSPQPYRVRILTHTVGPFELAPSRMFEQALKALVARGTRVTLLFGEEPDSMHELKQKMLVRLQTFGIQIYRHKDVHAKMIVAEGPGWSRVFLGSANLTSNAIDNFHEAAVTGSVQDIGTLAALDTFVSDRLKAPGAHNLSAWSQWWKP